MKTAKEKIQKVESKLLLPNNLDTEKLENLVSSMQGTSESFGDIYFSRNVAEDWILDESKVKSGSFSISQGVGVRLCLGEQNALAFTEEVSSNAILEAIKATKIISKGNSSKNIRINSDPKYKILTKKSYDPINSIARDVKVQILQEMDSFARQLDSRVIQVNARIMLSDTSNLVVNTDGLIAADIVPNVKITCSVVVDDKGTKEQGYSSSGRMHDASFFFEEVPIIPMDYVAGITKLSADILTEKRYIAIARDAVRQALVNLNAQKIQGGTMPVVLNAGWPAVLIHEAIGHGLEADAIRKNISVFSDKMGQQVASSLCTIVDDGTLENGTGTHDTDSEGTPSQYNVLIENGKLVGYMYDRAEASLMKAKPTGNGRRMDYRCKPIPRMTNTYLLPGNDTPEDILSSTDNGIYIVSLKGGQVNPTTGEFTFTADEAYMIEKGQIKYPVKNTTLLGSCLETMGKVCMLGNDLKFDKGVGACGKAGQSVAVGIGQPTVKLSEMLVGGSK